MSQSTSTLQALQPAPAVPLRVMKFGGTSVAGADRLRQVADLAEAALKEGRVLLVASAMSGVTDFLVAGASRPDPEGGPGDFLARHAAVLRDLALPEGLRARAEARLEALAAELGQLLQGIRLLRSCPPPSHARLASLGERGSCTLLAALLEARALAPVELDPCKALPCEGDPLEASPRPEAIRDALAPFRLGGAPLGLLPGFFGGDAQGEPVLLGRGGSDLSAALAAAALDADLLEIWTDVDGVHTADPRVVAAAPCLPELSYEEAMELAHFGAKVLHPRTLAPVRHLAIPVRVRSSFRPDLPGTLVHGGAPSAERPARGLSLLKGMALLDLAGPGMRGVPGVAARAFAALAAKEVNVVLITQGSSECALTLCVKEAEGEAAAAALEKAFGPEIAAGLVDPVVLRRGFSVLSLVGDGMRHRPGVAGGLFGALGDHGCNVAAIAQGASERSISAVLEAGDGERALAAAHVRFFEDPEPPRLDLVLLGPGLVGSELLARLAAKADPALRLCAVADSRRMALDPAGLDPAAAKAALAGGAPADFEALVDLGSRLRNPVLVDCTASEAVAEAYGRFAAAGFHVVTACKRLGGGSGARRRAFLEALAQRGRRFLDEATVGAGLPVLGTLRDLRAGGEAVDRIEGLLSGSLSYILGRLEDGAPLSAAVAEAQAKGFTEPDPREDLSGLDLARKALILHRELGGALEPEQVEVEPVPLDDAGLAARVGALQAEGKVLRYGATVTAASCRVGFLEVEAGSALAAVRDGENAVAFSSAAYSPRPLVVRGYGAGAGVTAAMVLADLVRLAGLGKEVRR